MPHSGPREVGDITITQTCGDDRHEECSGAVGYYADPCDCDCHVMQSDEQAPIAGAEAALHNMDPDAPPLTQRLRQEGYMSFADMLRLGIMTEE